MPDAQPSASSDAQDREGLLERDGELDALAGVLAAGSEGRGGFALIDAAAGLGKSRLCEVARAWGEAAGMEVLAAAAGPLDREFPFGVARKLFDHRLERAGRAERGRLLAGAAGIASPLFHAGERPVGNSEEMGLVYGLYWLAVGLSEADGMLLVVDDAHWADSSSLRFLLYLVRRLESLPITVVVAMRGAEPGSDARLLGELREVAGANVLSPPRLSESAVERLVREAMPDEADPLFCAACATATAGNPFMLVELLRELREEGILPTEGAAERVSALTPQVVLRTLLNRLALLPHAAASVARSAAVLGEAALLRHVAALADIDIAEAAEMADVLVEAGIMVSGDPMRFEHPLVVSGIAADIPAAERARLHSHAARLLHEEGGPAEHVVAHLMRAQRAGERWVVEALMQSAGEASARGAAEAAVAWLQRALEEPAPTDLRPQLLADLGGAHAASGDFASAGQALAEAVELTDEPRARAQLCLALGRTLYAAGAPGEAATAFDRGRAELDQLDDPDDVLARELRALTVSCFWLDPSLAEQGSRELDTLLEETREPTGAERAVLGQLALQEGFVAGGSAERTRELARRALGDRGWLRAPGGPDMVTLGLITGGLSVADAFEDSIELYTEAIDLARRAGSVLVYAGACYARGAPAYFAGRLVEARADLEEALTAGDGQWEMYRVVARAYLAYVCLEQGDLDAAREALAVDVEPEAAGVQYVSFLDARGRLALAEGDAEEALAHHLRAGELAAAILGDVNPGAFPWRSNAALAAMRLGERERARELVGPELATARGFGASRQLGVALRVSGVVEGGSEGISLLEEAVDVLTDSPAALERAIAQVELGAALRRAGERVRAREHLLPAAQAADRAIARPLLERARDELRATGARPRSLQLTGVDSLTASERRVASMAAEGMSNPQIAQALFVTRKAIEFHLSNVYSKLDIKSRKELPKALGSPPQLTG